MAHALGNQDIRILETLQKQCRISAQDLAAETNMSSATCWRRQRELEKKGVINGYRAILDRHALGLAVSAFVHISVERQYPDIINEIEDKIRARPEILECYATTGDADFTLRVVAKDIEDYDRFLQTFLFQLPGVGQVRSSITLREVKQTTELPLSRLD